MVCGTDFWRISQELGYIQGVGENKPGPMPPGYSLLLCEREKEKERAREREKVVVCVCREREREVVCVFVVSGFILFSNGYTMRTCLCTNKCV